MVVIPKNGFMIRKFAIIAENENLLKISFCIHKLVSLGSVTMSYHVYTGVSRSKDAEQISSSNLKQSRAIIRKPAYAKFEQHRRCLTSASVVHHVHCQISIMLLVFLINTRQLRKLIGHVRILPGLLS